MIVTKIAVTTAILFGVLLGAANTIDGMLTLMGRPQPPMWLAFLGLVSTIGAVSAGVVAIISLVWYL